MTLDWNVKYFLGIPEMDAEHCRIIEMITLLDHVKGRPDPLQSVWKVVNDMANYVTTHFTHEESLMERSGYPDLSRHRDAHRLFEEKVLDLRSRASLDSDEIRQLLQQWLEEHILKMDRAYVTHVQAWLDMRGGGER